MKLKNKVVVITGAAGGQGTVISNVFAKEGADIVGIDINLEGLKKTIEEVKKIGRRGLVINADVTKVNEVDEAFKKVEDEFERVDILVNAAGVLGKMNYMITQTEEDWDYVVDVNAKGTFLCDKAAVLLMIKNIKAKKQEKGKIINISSIVGRRGTALCSLYNASKFAVTGLTQSLAQEVGEYKINVNAIGPGIVDTPMNIDEAQQTAKLLNKTPEDVNREFIEATPLKRLTLPIDVANACLFFASDDSDMITGQTLNVCGGIFVE